MARRAHHQRAGRLRGAQDDPALPRQSPQLDPVGDGIDWATGEALAFASLLDEGLPVRLSGQDCERGTFSQRHSVLIDQQTEARYIPFNHIRDGQARYEVINSMLSEEAVLGFEYGYSLAEPNALTLWEAQFGDFANGAQVVFDQFISRASASGCACPASSACCRTATKGRGRSIPRRVSSAICRCARKTTCRSSTARRRPISSMSLRRQLKREFRKPLIADDAEVDAAQQARGLEPRGVQRGHDVPSPALGPAETHKGEKIKLARDEKIRRVILCSGKVYYDLYEDREKRGIDDVYMLRVEQLYPFPLKALVKELSRFKKAEIVWCQEEPKNMGSWTFVEPYLEWVLGAGRRQVEASPLRRPSGRRGDGDRPDVQASGAVEGVPRRMLRGLTMGSALTPWPISSGKLVPPRKAFAVDMTAQEASVMRAHVDYWLPQSMPGIVIAMGPVADPAGDWGVAIVNAPSLAGGEGAGGGSRRSSRGRAFVMRIFRCRRFGSLRSSRSRRCFRLPLNRRAPLSARCENGH